MRSSAESYVPSDAGLDELRAAAAGCRGCTLHRDATQTVFGAGPASAKVLIVGEQPGDQEDREGEPFVGPAGRLLDRALDEAGIDRTKVYVTNAVSGACGANHQTERRHRACEGASNAFQVPARGARQATNTPEAVAYGGGGVPAVAHRGTGHRAAAAQSMLGSGFRVTRQRGDVVELPDRPERAVATVHPSSVLRADDREAAYQGLVADLKSAAAALRG